MSTALLSAGEAQRLTQRIKLTASTVRDGLFKLRNLVDEAKNSNAYQVLGYQSWTAYLSDTLADEPMRLGRDERQELVSYLSGEGLSTRAIAPIVGASQKTVDRDIRGESNDSPAEPVHTVDTPADPEPEFDPTPVLPPREDDWIAADPNTGEVIDLPVTVTETHTVKTVTGLDGKTYPKPEPKADRRRSLVDDAYTASRELWKAVERVRTIRGDDRYTRNKADILAALQPSIDLALEVLQDL